MNDALAISKTTYTRILRIRSLYILLLAAVGLVAVAHMYNDLSAGRQKELMYDAAGALLTLAGLLTALIAPFDIARDLREKLVLTLLSKPLGRTHYLLGKFLGVACLVTVNLAILTLSMMWVLHLETNVWRWDFLQMAITTWASMIMVVALGVMLATFLSELPATLIAIAIFGFGHSTEWLHRGATDIIFRLLPSFGLLNYKVEFGNGLPITWSLIIMSVAYAMFYSGFLLSLGSIFFNKRDLA